MTVKNIPLGCTNDTDVPEEIEFHIDIAFC